MFVRPTRAVVPRPIRVRASSQTSPSPFPTLLSPTFPFTTPKNSGTGSGTAHRDAPLDVQPPLGAGESPPHPAYCCLHWHLYLQTPFPPCLAPVSGFFLVEANWLYYIFLVVSEGAATRHRVPPSKTPDGRPQEEGCGNLHC